MVLSRESFENFVVNKLGLTNWKSSFEESKIKFVEELILAFGHKIYFQNIKSCSLEIPDRKGPTPEECIDFISGEGNVGGCCIHNNYYFKCLLEYLGLDAYLTGVDMPSFSDIPPSPHVLVILRMNENEVYAIDVGYTRPILRAINLNQLPFRGRAGGFDYELRFNQETGKYERILFLGDPGSGVLKELKGEEYLDYFFDLTRRPFEYFDDAMGKLFVDADAKFMQMPFMYLLTRVKSAEDFEYVSATKNMICKGSRDDFQVTVYDTYQEMLPAIEEIFPLMDKNLLRTAFRKYDEYNQQKEEEKLKENENENKSN